MQQKKSSAATSLMRGLEVMRAFQASEALLGNNEIVERTGLPKSTVARFTYTLTKLGYLHQEGPLGRYRLDDKVVHLGHMLLANLFICQIAQPLMQKMADEYNMSVALGAGDRAAMVYIVYCQGRETVARRMRTGSMVPMAETAMGRGYLWALPPARRAWHLTQIGASAGDAADDQLIAIEKSLVELDRDGFYCSLGEWRRERYAVGAPVLLDGGETVLGLSGSSSRHERSEEEFREAIGPTLVKIAADIANTMSDLGRNFWDE